MSRGRTDWGLARLSRRNSRNLQSARTEWARLEELGGGLTLQGYAELAHTAAGHAVVGAGSGAKTAELESLRCIALV